MSPHLHVHSEDSLRNITNRLSRAEGHVRGIQDMVKEGRSCPNILIQIKAVRSAINRVARIILSEHLTHCLHQGMEDNELDVEVKALREVLKKFV